MTKNFLKLPQVMQKTSLSRTSVYRMMANNEFPKSYGVGDRSKIWLESEIEEWMESIVTANNSKSESV